MGAFVGYGVCCPVGNGVGAFVGGDVGCVEGKGVGECVGLSVGEGVIGGKRQAWAMSLVRVEMRAIHPFFSVHPDTPRVGLGSVASLFFPREGVI